MKPIIARRGAGHGSGLGKVRWVIERTFAWLHSFRRLRTRYQRSGALHNAFLVLGAVATLNLRVLRPGSSPTADATLGDALAVWDDAESRLEIELGARAVAYAVSRKGSLTLEQVYSLLWPRGHDARGAGLNAYSRYSELVRADRLVLSSALEEQVPEITLGPTTEADVEAALRSTGLARVAAPTTSAEALQRHVADLLTRPIDVGSVSGYARAVSASRHAGSVVVTLELPEAAG